MTEPDIAAIAIRPGESLRFTKAEKAKMRALVEELVRQQWQTQVSPLLAALRPSA